MQHGEAYGNCPHGGRSIPRFLTIFQGKKRLRPLGRSATRLRPAVAELSSRAGDLFKEFQTKVPDEGASLQDRACAIFFLHALIFFGGMRLSSTTVLHSRAPAPRAPGYGQLQLSLSEPLLCRERLLRVLRQEPAWVRKPRRVGRDERSWG
jgi:hypothetical protein